MGGNRHPSLHVLYNQLKIKTTLRSAIILLYLIMWNAGWPVRYDCACEWWDRLATVERERERVERVEGHLYANRIHAVICCPTVFVPLLQRIFLAPLLSFYFLLAWSVHTKAIKPNFSANWSMLFFYTLFPSQILPSWFLFYVRYEWT